MSAPESYQLEAFSSEGDFGKPPSPTASFDPSAVRWLNQDTRRREVCKIVGRALATISCAVILIICLSWYSYPALDDTSVWPVLCLPGVCHAPLPPSPYPPLSHLALRRGSVSLR